MKEEVKKLWTERLRSGKDKQGVGCLHRDDQFCCMGVLSEIAVEHGVIPAPIRNDVTDDYGYGQRKDTAVLPQEVMEWAGINECTGVYRADTGEVRCLTGDNDVCKTFAEIADIIEKHL